MGDGLRRAFAAAKATRQQRVPESGVLRACLDLLAAERIWHRRWNTGAVKLDSRFMRFGHKGDADIEMTIPAEYCGKEARYQKVVWVECKSADGRQTEEQREFQREVEDRGHYYLLVRSSDDLLEWLKEHGVIAQ
jgi:hypothetical protein